MTDDVLVRFLDDGLIDVKGDDSRLEKLTTVAGNLADIVLQTPSKAVPFAMIAFDPQAPANDPVFQEVTDTLKAVWKTYANAFPEAPATVFRALLLEALWRTSRKNPAIGVAFVALARNLLPLTEGGNEQAIWREVVGSVEADIDARAEAEWATPETITVPPISLDIPSGNLVEVTKQQADRNRLEQQIWAAAGPSGGDTQFERNQHWPQPNQNWANGFVPKMVSAIGDALDAAIDNIEISEVDITEPLHQLADNISSHIGKTLAAVSAATAGLQRRTYLLWWKEALYSPSARIGYRELSAPVAVGLMALDLHRQIPTFSPASVSAFLLETVRCLPDANVGTPLRVGEFLDAIAAADEAEALRCAAKEMVPAPAGRGPLLGLIGHGGTTAASDGAKFRALYGIPADTELTLPQWAAWIFRELQAVRAVAEAPAPAGKVAVGKVQLDG